MVDRDYWPDRYLDSLPPSVFALPLHEVENLLCVSDVFLCVARHLGTSEDDAKEQYDAAIVGAKAKFDGPFLAKQISERFRRRCQHEFSSSLSSLEIDGELEAMGRQHVEALDPQKWETAPAQLFGEERALVEGALGAGHEEFLRVLPGKAFVGIFADALGLNQQAYLELICNALSAVDDGPLVQLGTEIEARLADLLPPRTVVGGQP